MKHLLAGLALAALSAAASAQVQFYTTVLSGAYEAVPNASSASGFAWVIVDEATNKMQIQMNYANLAGLSTGAHIHCCTATPLSGTAPVATAVPAFATFPLGLHSSPFTQTFSLLDAATYNPAFLADHGGTPALAEQALLAGLAANEGYLNVHSDVYPAGEIRGFLIAQAVPEPAQWGMLTLGLAALGLARRKHRPRSQG
ncbi:MAG: CHRD domain-containing protein [Telluria sp.]